MLYPLVSPSVHSHSIVGSEEAESSLDLSRRCQRLTLLVQRRRLMRCSAVKIIPRKFRSSQRTLLTWLICLVLVTTVVYIPTIITTNTTASVATDTNTRGKGRTKVALPKCFKDSVVHEGPIEIPPDGVLVNMTYEDITCLFHSYVEEIQIKCDNIVRLGNKKDGGWEVCDDPKYKLDKDCLVYSGGISYDFSFDDAIAKRYLCEVHSFDPSMKTPSYDRSWKVTFHNIGLGDRDTQQSNGWEMKRLTTIKNELGHSNRPIDVLKMDIERSEWNVLDDAVASGVLNDVKILDLELHTWLLRNNVYIFEAPNGEYLHYLKTLRSLYEIGFRLYLTRWNMQCRYQAIFGMIRTACYEIGMLNINK